MPDDAAPPQPALRRRPPRAGRAPALDADQRRVVEHPGGPLLVLAGPGTGKTTTLVEAVVDRVERRGLAPEQVLVLTFSRKAAQELRERITGRLGRTTRGPVALTFHGYAYALLRRELGGPDGAGLRLLSGPEQDLEVARLLAGERESGAAARWPEALRPALGLRGFRQELRDLLLRAQERGVEARQLALLGERRRRPEWVAAAGFLAEYEGRFDVDPSAEVLDYAGLVRSAAGLLENDDALREAERRDRAVVLVDEFQDTDPAQLRLLQALAGDGRDLVAVGDPDQSIYAFRGADVGGTLRFGELFPTAAGEPTPVVELRTCRRSGAALLAASRAVAARLPAGALGPGFRDLVPDPAVVAGPGQRRGAAGHLADRRGRAGRRRPAPRPPARRRPVVRHGGPAPLHPAVAGHPAARPARRRRAGRGARRRAAARRGARRAGAARPAGGGAAAGRRRRAAGGGPAQRAARACRRPRGAPAAAGPAGGRPRRRRQHPVRRAARGGRPRPPRRPAADRPGPPAAGGGGPAAAGRPRRRRDRHGRGRAVGRLGGRAAGAAAGRGEPRRRSPRGGRRPGARHRHRPVRRRRPLRRPAARRLACSASWTTSPPRRSPATPWPSARPRATPSG